jgi:HD-GYP domain-containing protein (c-di-GMP phosphodiesterase class II)
MQRLAMELIRPEMISAVDVEDAGGRILIRAGRPLQENHIKTMQALGYGSAYVNLPYLSETRSTGDIIRPDLRTEAIKLIRQVYENFITKEGIDATPIRDLASRLVSEVILNRGQLFQLVDLRTPDTYLPAHVVNVAVLSILAGLKMEYSTAKLHELAIGALVMDIGEMLVPPEILRKTGELTPEEMQQVKQHPETGFEGLRKKLNGLPATSMHVAYQHHESFVGKGYPRGISGTAIQEYARIACVADMFDALLSDRPFRRYYLPQEAASILHALGGRLLDPGIVTQLTASIAPYPKGSLVQLDTCELCEVESVNLRNPARPQLQLLTDAWGNRRKDLDRMDLEKISSRYIIKGLKDQEIIDWVTS